ncbi:MAG TPA: 4-hydroxythreonine-4-phosphate dehydrogenase PdxA [Bacillales bacterium]|nr:4-hydroxythreonine-4-phosphate dehydrogenase PdxA [Bacillales bacterium]
MNDKPIIGITMGDAAGVGSEIILKTLNDKSLYEQCRPVVIGDSKIINKTLGFLNIKLQIKSIQSVDEAAFQYGTVDCIDLDLVPEKIPYGEISKEAGDAAFQFLKKAIELAQKKAIDAICTAPLNKEALHLAGHMYPGHTEILAELTNTKHYAMLLSAPKLKVIHVTTHIGIIKAIQQINPERVYRTIRLAHETLCRAGIESPRIAVCGINPHAGENGLFGQGEEEQKIIPAVEKAQSERIDVIGPLPADTLFYRTVRSDFDVVVAMYHDQGHGPVKVLGLEAGVNITAGLPIVRVSVDHGTAFDIAGKGIADELSMKEALKQAVMMSAKNSRNTKG